jgi:hypothetical protein
MFKAIFFGGVILGLAAVIGAAGYYPWIDHPRPLSRTQVVPNGGRLELFTVRLPDDRIAAAGNAALPGAGPAFPADELLPPGPTAEALRVEHFKLRDAAGDVVGIAARHTLALEAGPAVAWSLTLPSRGSMWLAGSVSPSAIATGLAASGYTPGQSWAGSAIIAAGPAGGPSGQIDGGSGEFRTLHGSYDERWQITAVDAEGALTGAIELQTTTFLN